MRSNSLQTGAGILPMKEFITWDDKISLESARWPKLEFTSIEVNVAEVGNENENLQLKRKSDRKMRKGVWDFTRIIRRLALHEYYENAVRGRFFQESVQRTHQ